MPNANASFRVEALGPVQVYRGPSVLDLGPPKQRAVFALLVLRAGEAVSVDSLRDSVWGESAPASARHLVHTYVARLRQVLEPETPRRERMNVIASTPSGYRLLVDPEKVDLLRFRQLVTQAGQHSSVGERARTFDLLAEALRLWRDPLLTELSALLPGSSHIELLRRAWTEASLNHITIGLELGEAPAILVQAHQLAVTEPMNEEVQARYLVVLQHTGQRAAAIEHFADLRARLSEELGVEPGPQLAGAYRQVLLGAGQHPAEPLRAVAAAVPARPPWRGPGPGLGELLQRADDIKALTEILSARRLFTLAGPPGCGKSTLALHTAAGLRDAFLGGVAVVECSELTTLVELKSSLLGLIDGLSDADVTKVLGQQQVLLVFDNVEHLVDPCATLVDEIVRGCRHVSVLVTSREPLGLPDETVWRVATLTTPDPHAWPGDNPSVLLFARRAAQVCPGFQLGSDNIEAVAAICRRLDGLPLALEMTAACLATDTLDGLYRRLDDPLNLIRPSRRGLPAHHRSLRAALHRSVNCLTEMERWCFARLGCLPARFDLCSAQQACQPLSTDLQDVLNQLANKSLLYVEHGRQRASYRMLWLVHRFAAELAAGEAVVRAGRAPSSVLL